MQEIALRVAQTTELEQLVNLLHDADEDDQVISKYATNPACTSYFAETSQNSTSPIGAATILWAGPESEIIHIAIRPDLRGQGYGKALMSELLQEARRHGVPALLIGTDNTALDTIFFYQKCGFRIDHVRPDYFNYIQPPAFNNGLQIRDMLVLRHPLE